PSSRLHTRNPSSATILFDPQPAPSGSASPNKRPLTVTKNTSSGPSETLTPGMRTPNNSKRPQLNHANTGAARPRPIMPPRALNQSAPNIASFLALDRRDRKPSFNARALDLASDLGDNRFGPDVGKLGAMPASWGTQMEMAQRMRGHQQGQQQQRRGQGQGQQQQKQQGQGQLGPQQQQQRKRATWKNVVEEGDGDEDEDGDDMDEEEDDAKEETTRMSKLVLARMNALEEGFREVLKEVKGLRSYGGSVVGSTQEDGGGAGLQVPRRREKGKERERERERKGDRERAKRKVPLERKASSDKGRGEKEADEEAERSSV
ncbi:hypothetical protein LTS18_008763, partial [Coniosporium uncinatum]